MKKTLSILPCFLAFALHAPAAEKAKIPVAVKSQTEITPAETTDTSKEERVQRLQAEIDKREAEVVTLRHRIEAEKKQALDNSEGNLNHSKALIEAEKKALMRKSRRRLKKSRMLKLVRSKVLKTTSRKTRPSAMSKRWLPSKPFSIALKLLSMR